MEPNCISYNFNKKEEVNGLHKCDLNNATYERDNEHSGDLAQNENYVHRGAEVNIQIPSTLSYAREICKQSYILWLGPPGGGGG